LATYNALRGCVTTACSTRDSWGDDDVDGDALGEASAGEADADGDGDGDGISNMDGGRVGDDSDENMDGRDARVANRTRVKLQLTSWTTPTWF
jgi:hypothetical protein